MSATKYVLAFLFCLAGLPCCAIAADGYFDPGWAGSGRITLAPCNDVASVSRVVVADNGNIFLGGPCRTTAGSQSWWLGELSPAGVPVIAFGGAGNGLVIGCALSVDQCSADYFRDMLVQPDGKIVFATDQSIGRTVAHAYSLDVANVTGGNGIPAANGAGFVHVNGISINTNAGGKFTGAQAIARTSDGKLLVAGDGLYSASSSYLDMAVVRLNPDLSLDTSFNNTTDGNGVHFAGGRTIDFSGDSDGATGILVQPDGRILLFGYTYLPGTLSSAVARLNGDGTLDTTFGSGTGIETLAWSGGSLDLPFVDNPGVTLDRAGRILIAVQASIHSNGKDIWGMAVMRLLSDGSVDPSFGDGQIAFQPFADFCKGTQGARAYALALDSAGRILVAGTCNVSNTIYNFLVTRLFGDTGGLDTSFGIAGRSYGVFADPDTYDAAFDIAFDKSGRPIVGGRSNKSVDSSYTRLVSVAWVTT